MAGEHDELTVTYLIQLELRGFDEPVRRFLVRRHKVPSRGIARFSSTMIFGELGVLRLGQLHFGAPPWASG